MEPSPSDDGRAQHARWARKQRHYQDAEVVAGYDAARFTGLRSSRATRRKWKAITAALGSELERCASFLDLPCGTGRFSALLEGAGKRFVEADLSLSMLAAASRASFGSRGFAGSVCCDAARLPFADASFDVVLSVRFLFHVPRDLRPSILREMGRVARRYVLVDVRHAYAWSAWTRRWRARLTRARVPHRYTLRELDQDFAAAGLSILRKRWLTPLFSEKMIVLARREE